MIRCGAALSASQPLRWRCTMNASGYSTGTSRPQIVGTPVFAGEVTTTLNQSRSRCQSADPAIGYLEKGERAGPATGRHAGDGGECGHRGASNDGTIGNV